MPQNLFSENDGIVKAGTFGEMYIAVALEF